MRTSGEETRFPISLTNRMPHEAPARYRADRDRGKSATLCHAGDAGAFPAASGTAQGEARGFAKSHHT
jgi:hypothetical protein